MNISTATGDELDKIAELWGLQRSLNSPTNGNGMSIVESDDSLRYRIRNMAMGDSGGSYIDPNLLDFDDVELPEGLVPVETKATTTQKCECGAASLGYTQPGPGHASWCPIASK